jgi:death-on-curing protein
LSEPERIFTAEDLIQLNQDMLEYGGGLQGGVRYESGLLLALDKPWLAFGGSAPLYPEPHDKAAALMETLIRTHPFVDGNKRTAYTAGITLLRYLTGEIVEVSPEEALAVCQSVERKDWGTEELSAWLLDNAY